MQTGFWFTTVPSAAHCTARVRRWAEPLRAGLRPRRRTPTPGEPAPLAFEHDRPHSLPEIVGDVRGRRARQRQQRGGQPRGAEPAPHQKVCLTRTSIA